MFDLASPKILVPAALFALLSPGVLLSLPSTNIASMTTSTKTIFIHALVLVLVYWGLVKSKIVPVSITKADLIIPAILFILLSPTMLPIFKSTSVYAVILSTLVFVLLFGFLRSKFPQYY
jgi:hypothetical protein